MQPKSLWKIGFPFLIFFFSLKQVENKLTPVKLWTPAAQGRAEPRGQQHPAGMEGWSIAPGLAPGLGGWIRGVGVSMAPHSWPHAAALPGGLGSSARGGGMEGAGNLLSFPLQKKHRDGFPKVHWGRKVNF